MYYRALLIYQPHPKDSSATRTEKLLCIYGSFEDIYGSLECIWGSLSVYRALLKYQPCPRNSSAMGIEQLFCIFKVLLSA